MPPPGTSERKGCGPPECSWTTAREACSVASLAPIVGSFNAKCNIKVCRFWPVKMTTHECRMTKECSKPKREMEDRQASRHSDHSSIRISSFLSHVRDDVVAGGELVRRPIPPAAMLKKNPARHKGSRFCEIPSLLVAVSVGEF